MYSDNNNTKTNIMNNYNEIIKEVSNTNSVTRLYKRLDNSYYIIKRDLNGYVLKTKMNISFGDNSTTNKLNALMFFEDF